MTPIRPRALAALLLLLAGCGAEPPANAAAHAAALTAPAEHAWRANPSASRVTLAGDTLVVETATHTVAWEEPAPELTPPYEVRATIRKRSGRLHEGTGVVFGGTGLEGPEAGQVYTYFLTRGDGSFLVKRRQGAETPVVRDWTRHPAVRRDTDAGGRPNELVVRVGDAETVFLVNGSEVARIPSADLAVRGRAGIRASHDVQIEVSGFEAGADHP
ncbi:MAG: hypothetical protein ICV87_05950 [Gemmatimonadetes bacterium]|nr:hypothetical protein [Gemmatimonadota bacterium]